MNELVQANNSKVKYSYKRPESKERKVIIMRFLTGVKDQHGV